MKMYKVFNFIEDKAINLPLTENRGFLYGDGFFETIIVKNGRLLSFEQHYDRMLYASKQLNLLPFPSKKAIKTLLKSYRNSNSVETRLKVIVFRNSDGLFAPNKNSPLFYFEEKNTLPTRVLNKSAFFSTSVFNKESITSSFKTLSSLKYVLAGIELKKKTCDEIILLDDEQNISECLSSNIWWIKNDTIFCPSTSTGCIDGVAKKNILCHLATKKVKVHIGKFKKTEILKADFCFTSNVAGLHIIKSIERSLFKTSHELFHDIKQALF